MASLQLSILLLLCVLFVLGLQVEGKRSVSPRRKDSKDTAVSSTLEKNDEDNDDDDDDISVPAGNRVLRDARRKPGKKTTVDKKPVSGGKIKPKKPKDKKPVGGGKIKPKKPKYLKGNKLGKAADRLGGKRKLLAANKAEKVSKMEKSVDKFSVSLYKKMADANPDNFVCSPYSVFSALTMLLLGAAGRTKTELASGLSITSPVHPAIKIYSEKFDFDLDDDTVLAVANNLYYRTGLQLNPRFVKKLQKFYGATTEPFQNVDPESVVNAWVEQNTHGKITDFLSPGFITPQTQAMLINAVYFKGAWNSKFDANQTRPLPFYVAPLQGTPVDTMTQMGDFRMSWSTPLDATLLELPYVGDEFAFFVILPNTNLSAVESRLTADLLSAEISSTIQRPVRNVHVQLPKFNLDTEEQMKEMLQNLGINQLFDPSKASLKKMTKDKAVSVSEVIHRAVIEVDEEGTVAAAATGTIMLMSGPLDVTVNRPFMFVLRDKVYGINLFIGRYTNPGGENLKN